MKAVTKFAWATGIVVLGVASGATTYSLWSDPAAIAAGSITAGNLQLDKSGTTVWTETSPDVPLTTNAGKTIDPATFLATPGDTFSIKQSFISTFEGENMLGKVAVRWDKAAALPAGVSATYTLKTPGTPGVSAPLGTPVSIPDLPVGTATWTVEVDLKIAGSKADRFGDPAELAKLGNIVVDLDQVRTGKGFN
ncbi:alternate-type signal peptide domain-containing protein [Paeniglutamicibacter sp. NPDC091659]|uniref:alternate-type signal peptide domain-containing protein n=1 Tax=Paeniglutamicibacter sp. NPDC091659 TaxID=3364389 RepID=UPI0038113F9D